MTWLFMQFFPFTSSPPSGHGPYSHLWESFVKQARVQRAKDPSYKPEEVREQKLKPNIFF